MQDLERATGPRHAEPLAILDSFMLTAASLHQARLAPGGLVVDTDRMARNLGIGRGLSVADVVMMASAPRKTAS